MIFQISPELPIARILDSATLFPLPIYLLIAKKRLAGRTGPV